jgi:hypothetical protein
MRCATTSLCYGVVVVAALLCMRIAASAAGWPTDPQLAKWIVYKTYSVLDVGKPRVPTLDRAQRLWLRRIRATPAYRSSWRYLRFSTIVFKKYAPLTVIDSRNVDITSGIQVIGAPCGLYFNPYRQGLYAAPQDVACNPPTPEPLVPASDVR